MQLHYCPYCESDKLGKQRKVVLGRMILKCCEECFIELRTRLRQKSPVKTASISLDEIKDSDGWNEVAHELELSKETKDKHFKYGEYASLTVEIDKDLNIVGGHIH